MAKIKDIQNKLERIEKKIEKVKAVAEQTPKKITKFGEMWEEKEILGPTTLYAACLGYEVYDNLTYEANDGEDYSLFGNSIVGKAISAVLGIAVGAAVLPLALAWDTVYTLPATAIVGAKTAANKNLNKRIEKAQEMLPQLEEEKLGLERELKQFQVNEQGVGQE